MCGFVSTVAGSIDGLAAFHFFWTYKSRTYLVDHSRLHAVKWPSHENLVQSTHYSSIEILGFFSNVRTELMFNVCIEELVTHTYVLASVLVWQHNWDLHTVG